MKQLEIAKDVYLKDYEVNVHPYLDLAQIELIVNGICSSGNEYSDRKMTEDMLILYHATDIGKEALEATEYVVLQRSGLIKAVRDKIKNIDEIYDCLHYTESIERSLVMLYPQIKPIIEKFGELNGKNTDKK